MDSPPNKGFRLIESIRNSRDKMESICGFAKQGKLRIFGRELQKNRWSSTLINRDPSTEEKKSQKREKRKAFYSYTFKKFKIKLLCDSIIECHDQMIFF